MASLKQDIARTWDLAWPIMLSQAVIIGMSNIDVVMVGHYSSDEQAYLSIGRQLFWVSAIVGSVMLSGIQVFISRADGAGALSDCGPLWRQGAAYSLALGGLLLLVMILGGERMLAAMGMSRAIVTEGGDYIVMTALGMPAVLLAMANMGAFEGISRPKPAMMVSLGILPLNVALNWLMIGGNWGFPAMGATGAALASTLCFLVSATVGTWLLIRLPAHRPYGFRLLGRVSGLLDGLRKLVLFGLAPGLAAGVEMGSFALLTFYTGILGELEAAAFAVFTSLHSISFIIPIGLATAASVRTGNAVGRNDYQAIPRVVLIAIGMVSLCHMLFGLCFWLFPETLAGLYTFDGQTRDMAARMLWLVAAFLLFDGIQFVFLLSLRAAGDQIMAAVIQILTMWGGMALLGWVLTFPVGLGADGPVWGLNIAIIAAAAGLGGRFWMMSRRWRAKAIPEGSAA